MIKKLMTLLFIVIILFSCREKWSKVLSCNEETTIAGFINETHGITAGYAGDTKYTLDGGKTWNKGENKSFCRFGLEILNDDIAFHCGNGAQNRVTHDGGKTWDEITNFGLSEPNHCRYISFIDEYTGWIASLDKLGSTNNEGHEWEELRLPEDIGKILAIDLIDKTTGYLYDTNNNLYLTKDSGQNWTKEQVGINKKEYLLNAFETPSLVMRFSDVNNGIIIHKQVKPDKKLVALITNDGGKSWKKEDIPGEYDIFSVLFMSDDGSLLTVKSGNTVTVLKRNDS